jgi:hypothetical protein
MLSKQNMTPTGINQLMILQNFAMLQIKGLRHMAASKDIAQQWHDGKGIHFAHQIQIITQHYQRYKQLLVENQGGDCGHSLINNEQV